MNVTGLKIYKDLPFEEYLKLPGHSYSSIKNEGKEIQETAKMRLGTLVHCYLLTPALYSYEFYNIVRPAAVAVKREIGLLFKHLIPEFGMTANFCHEGFILSYKGRIDLGIPGKVIIDLKVTEKLNIDFFGYHHQLSGYAKGINAQRVFIITINPKTFITQTIPISIQTDWWEYQIKRKGIAS